MDAAQAIRELLELSGLTKSELSARSGVSRSLLDDYLKGRRQPSVAQVDRLGRAADLKLDLMWTPVPQTPHWARPHPSMDAPPLTISERAKVLEMVVAVAIEQQRHPRGPLEFPPFRSLIAEGTRA